MSTNTNLSFVNSSASPIAIASDRPTEPVGNACHADPRPRRVVLPRRFDVHRVADVVDRLNRELQLGGDVRIDGSRVQMIDLAAIESLRNLLGHNPVLRIEQPSVALRVTIEFTNADGIAAAFGPGQLLEAA